MSRPHSVGKNLTANTLTTMFTVPTWLENCTTRVERKDTNKALDGTENMKARGEIEGGNVC